MKPSTVELLRQTAAALREEADECTRTADQIDALIESKASSADSDAQPAPAPRMSAGGGQPPVKKFTTEGWARRHVEKLTKDGFPGTTMTRREGAWVVTPGS